MAGEVSVGGFRLFRKDLDGGEVGGKARAVELALLLFGVALGDEQEAVAGGQLGQGFGYAGEELDLGGGDGVGEADNAVMLLLCDRGGGEVFETVDKRAAEALETVAVLGDGLVLEVIELFAYLFGSVDAVVEVGDERG